MHKARIAALAVAAFAAAAPVVTAASAAPARTAASATAARPVGVLPWLTVRPNVVHLSMTDRLGPFGTAGCERSFGIACYQPGQIRSAYHLPALYARGVTGRGTTILIVDSFGSPTIRRDLKVFDKRFGYPAPPSFKIITPSGKIPPFNSNSLDMTGWAGETTLDVEYAHALAPGANILLAETPVSETEGVTGFPQIVTAEEFAIRNFPVDVISQSFSATEQTFKHVRLPKALRAAYVLARSRHVTVLAASGDSGATDVGTDLSTFYTHPVTSWPDSDPLVTAVGGTRLVPHGATFTSVAWNDTYDGATTQYFDNATPSPSASGGGRSAFFGRPSYQDGVRSVVGTRRGVPDISMSGACDGAVNIFSSFPDAFAQPGWSLICGTSEATPEFAAIVALAAQVAGHPLGLINPRLYALSARHAPGIVDVTSGSNTVSFAQGSPARLFTVRGFPALLGYDLVTGVGTVNAPLFVHELAGR